MTGEPIISVVGNLTDEPEIRYLPTGVAVCSFTVASTPRRWNREKNEWEDGTTLFQQCTVWREHAENVANTLRKGMRVVATGELQAQEWKNDKGEKRRGTSLLVQEVGPGLRWATAEVHRIQRDSQPPATPHGAGGNWDGQNDSWTTGSRDGGGRQSGGAPWGGSSSGGQAGWSGNGPSYDEPPF